MSSPIQEALSLSLPDQKRLMLKHVADICSTMLVTWYHELLPIASRNGLDAACGRPAAVCPSLLGQLLSEVITDMTIEACGQSIICAWDEHIVLTSPCHCQLRPCHSCSTCLQWNYRITA